MIMERPSSLELMLEKIRQMEDQPEDVPPALPTRPLTKARLPRSRRQLPFTSQRSNCQENRSVHMIPNFEESMFKNKRTKARDFGQVVYQQESAEMIGTRASALVIESADEKVEGYGSRNNANGILGKISNSDDGKELLLEGMLAIQRHLQGCQTCCYCHELKRGVVALQSFIRGENARKAYMRNMTAIAVIQKHVKGHLRSRTLDEQDQTIICLETRSQGWLAWKYFNSIDKKGKQLNENIRNARNLEKMDSKIKDQIQVPYSVLVDLQRRVLKTEALLDEKKEENAFLQLKIKLLERKREQYETKMKSMEKMWQDQLTSIQVSLAAAKKNSASKNTMGKLRQLLALPETHDQSAYDASPSTRTTEIGSMISGGQLIDQQHAVLANDAGIIIEDESGQVASGNNSDDDLQKLKLKFRTWKKDFKTRLLEAKTTMKKLGNSQTRKQRKWWGKMKKEETRSVVLYS